MDWLQSLIPGMLVVLASLARAEAQVRVLTTRGHAAVKRNRRLGGLCAIAGVFYAYALGVDHWLQCAGWINTICSVAGAFATASAGTPRSTSNPMKDDQ
jgi:hypothetical protein